MPEPQQAGGTAPEVPEAVPPAPTAGQAPASPTVPETPQTKTESGSTPQAPAKVEQSASSPSAEKPTEQLLTDLPSQKPTLDSLKIPKDSPIPKERLEAIVTAASTVEEAQRLVDFVHGERQRDLEMLKAQNTKWIQDLKSDPEFGGKNWEESKALYKKGVVQEFGEEFAKGLASMYQDGRPEIFKAVVRRMKAVQPKPVVQGTPPEPPKKQVDPWDRVYSSGPAEAAKIHRPA